MKFSVDKQDSYTVFGVLENKLNSILAPDLKTELVLLNNEGVRNIILDMSQVQFVDSSGLSAILVGNRLCQNVGGTLILAAITNSVKHLLQISQLDSILDLSPTIQEAKDLVMMNELERALTDVPEETEEKSTDSE